MASGDDLIKYLTERFVTYIDTPREVRRQEKVKVKEPWTTKWFGMIPFSVSLWKEDIKSRRSNKKGKPSQN